MAPALLLGFAGSVHCLGMCGPLQLAVLGWGNGKTLAKNAGVSTGKSAFVYRLRRFFWTSW